jgi:hypothetical protein
MILPSLNRKQFSALPLPGQHNQLQLDFPTLGFTNIEKIQMPLGII